MKRLSIRAVIGFVSTVFAVILLSAIIILFMSFQRQRENQDSYISNVRISNNIIISMNSLLDDLGEYRRSADENALVKYDQEVLGLEKQLDEYRRTSLIPDSEQEQIVRRLQAFLEYQEKEINSADTPGEIYSVTGYVATGLELHLTELHRLFQLDMNSRYLIYGENERALFQQTSD